MVREGLEECSMLWWEVLKVVREVLEESEVVDMEGEEDIHVCQL